MSRWLSLYWAWLLPALSLLPTLVRLVDLQAAYRHGLIRPRGRRWMAAGLAAAQALVWLAMLALVYRTATWLPAAGLAAIGVMLLAPYAARPDVHPGLHGLRRPLPRDGLELIELEQPSRRRRARLKQHLREWLSIVPALGLILYIAAYYPARWLDFSLLALIAAAPMLLIPSRRQWIAPLFLTLPVSVLLSQAVSERPSLPPGQWATPVTGARCAGAIRVASGRPAAWCADALAGTAYQFDLGTGVVNVESRIPEAARIFTARDGVGWVQQLPARGLMRVSAGAVEHVPIRSAMIGAADAEGRLWVVDVGLELSVYDAGGERTVLRASDGLLNNTANVVRVSASGDVWVGSFDGGSWLPRGAGVWQTMSREAGVPGAVINFAFAPDGTIWLLWQGRPGYGPRSNWGASALASDGTWVHVELGRQSGLDVPLSEDALAVDQYGRLWFVSQSIPRREKYLGVAAPTDSTPPQLYSLGRFASGGPYGYGTGLWRDTFGVVTDGEGGIIVYTGEAAAWRHWKPGWVAP